MTIIKEWLKFRDKIESAHILTPDTYAAFDKFQEYLETDENKHITIGEVRELLADMYEKLPDGDEELFKEVKDEVRKINSSTSTEGTELSFKNKPCPDDTHIFNEWSEKSKDWLCKNCKIPRRVYLAYKENRQGSSLN